MNMPESRMSLSIFVTAFWTLFTFFGLGTVVYGIGFPINSPVGYWKTVDEKTGKPQSIIQILETQDKQLQGKVVKTFSTSTQYSLKTCLACQGYQHNKPLVGLVVLSGITSVNNKWPKGKILNTETGKTYSCALELTDSGKKLSIKHYLKWPFMSKSQIWERIDLMAS